MTDVPPLAEMSVAELAELLQATVKAISQRSDPQAVEELSRLSAVVGEAIGVAALNAWGMGDGVRAQRGATFTGLATSSGGRRKSSSKSGSTGRPKPVLDAKSRRKVQAAPAARAHPITMYGINEAKPGPRWKELFDATWPAYRAWYLSKDSRRRPDRAKARRMLSEHMPELIPTYKKMVKLAGNDPTAARMLTLWDPPRFLPGCSQLVLANPDPILCRNYDYSPDLFERVIYSSEFTDRKVIGTGDCLWGLLDGMNDAGLVVSLTFGGRPGSGPGFGIPIVVRYLLEVAETTAQAREILYRLPVAMAYNLTMIDAGGNRLTAFVAPGMRPEFSDSPIATNHRGEVPDHPEHARRFRSVERREALTELEASNPTLEQVAAAFLAPPLYNTDFAGSFGTLYTAMYRPKERIAEFIWPHQSWRRTFDDPNESLAVVLYES